MDEVIGKLEGYVEGALARQHELETALAEERARRVDEERRRQEEERRRQEAEAEVARLRQELERLKR